MGECSQVAFFSAGHAVETPEADPEARVVVVMKNAQSGVPAMVVWPSDLVKSLRGPASLRFACEVVI